MNDPRETNPPPGAPTPGPKEQEPSVYGGVWGGGAAGQTTPAGPADAPDRPDKIKVPAEKE